MNFNSKHDIEGRSGRDIPELQLLDYLQPHYKIIVRTCEFFFKGLMKGNNLPFKGFLLEGPPGTGKTEIVKQVARNLDRKLGGNVFFVMVDGATIAAPKWGDAEKTLKAVFNEAKELSRIKKDPKIIILFDDIESLMMSRGFKLSKEWHYSINSVLFHEIDELDPTETIICATTNRPDLVDDALKSRLFSISIPSLPLDQLMVIVGNILEESKVNTDDKKEVERVVKEKLKSLKNATIRDAQKITIIECIEKGLWKL